MTRVSIVHDVLAARGGGERVALALAQAFPDAPIYTLVHEPASCFDGFEDRIRTSWLNGVRPLRRHFRATVPLAAMTFAARKIDADVTICSTSGLSHHVRCTGAKVVYCHTPAKWLHSHETYLQGFPAGVRLASTAVRPAFSRLDRLAMRQADQVLVNSSHIGEEVRDLYGIESSVIAPCSTLDLRGEVKEIPGVGSGFVLSPVRALGYKRLDVLVEAARRMPDRQFLHLGDGPHRRELAIGAPSNFLSVGAVDEAQLRWAYRNASVAALTCAEDFGLIPLEAAAHGLTTVAPHSRGLVDHDSEFLVTYSFGSAEALVDAITAAPEPTGVRRADRLGVERFVVSMRAALEVVS